MFVQILVLQIMGVFGLIFKDLFAELNMPATDVALILNLNMSFSLLMGKARCETA